MAKDIFGNQRSVSFYVKSSPLATVQPQAPKAKNIVRKFEYNKINAFATTDFEINMPKDVIYNDIDFEF